MSGPQDTSVGPDPVRIEDHPDRTVIVLDDGKVNVLSPRMLAALDVALDHAEARGAPVVVAGRPGVLTAGFDLTVMTGPDPAARAAMVRAGFEVTYRLLGLPLPVVVACTGHAIAMGAFLLTAGDRRIGAEGRFRIGANETPLGIVMPEFAIALTRDRLTPAAFDRALLTGDFLAPSAALAAGFLDEVVDPDVVVTRAEAVADHFATFDLAVYAETKRRVRAAWLARVRAAIDADAVALG